MRSPSPRGRPTSRRRSLLSQEEAHHHPQYHIHRPLITRPGTLASLIRSRSLQSLTGSWPPPAHRGQLQDDDEAASWSRHEDDDIERLLRDGTRLSQILKGPQVRSMNLIGKSNPRYRWERYWKNEQELKAMKKPM